MTYLIIFALISLSALFSGLTLGFFSLNRDDIKRKAELGNKDAKALYSVRKRGYLLLPTLLIGNVAVNSVLSIFLGSITNGLSAWVISTGLIVLFGEIAPQAVFSRYALTLGVKFVPLVKFFIIIFYPICGPLSWVLYKILGKEQDKIYSKQELVKIIEAHEDSKFSDIDEDEEKLVRGALSFSDKKVSKIMTPIKDVVMLNGANLFNENTIHSISSSGHSRIPVFKRTKNNIIGLLYVKDLVKAFDAFFNSDIESSVFNIGGGIDNTVSLLEYLNMLEGKLNTSINMDFSDWRPSDQKVYISNIEKVKSTLNWAAATSLGEGLDYLISWAKDNRDLF